MQSQHQASFNRETANNSQLSSLQDFLCSEERCINFANAAAADGSLPILPMDLAGSSCDHNASMTQPGGEYGDCYDSKQLVNSKKRGQRKMS